MQCLLYLSFYHIPTSHGGVPSTINYSRHEDKPKNVSERKSDVPLHQTEAWTPDIKPVYCH